VGSSRVGLCLTLGIMIKKGLSHLASACVVDTYKQDFLHRSNLIIAGDG
jgi:hypothetical protein